MMKICYYCDMEILPGEEVEYTIYDDGADGYKHKSCIESLRARAEALAAEVERLTAEANTLVDQVTELHEAVIELEDDNAALRAQLDAAGWRPVTEPPTEAGEYIVTGQYLGEDVFTTACTWYGDEWLSRHTELPVNFRVLRWQLLPAPPQE